VSIEAYDYGYQDGYATGKVEGLDPEMVDGWREDGESKYKQELIEAIETELGWKNLDDGFRGGLEWVLRQIRDPDAGGV
jgi:hypothetical protein